MSKQVGSSNAEKSLPGVIMKKGLGQAQYGEEGSDESYDNTIR